MTLISVTTCQRPSRSIVTLLRMIPLVCKSSSCITTHFHSSASFLPHCRRCQHQPCFVSVFAVLCLQRQALDARRDLNVGQAFGKHDLLCATSCPTAVLQSSWRPLPSGTDHPHRAAPLAANIPLFTWRVGHLVRRPILRTTFCLQYNLGSVFSCRMRSESRFRDRHASFVCEMTACVLALTCRHMS